MTTPPESNPASAEETAAIATALAVEQGEQTTNGENAENGESIAHAMASDDDSGIDLTEGPKIRHWKDSEFAVGCVNVTWEDDRPSWWCNHTPDESVTVDRKLALSAIVCGCLGAKRVGNMAILAQSTESVIEDICDPNTGAMTTRSRERPKLLWVIGPYWSVNLFITFPLIFGVSGWICYSRILDSNLAVIITWSIGTFLMVFSLCMISCRNPGILYRHPQIPGGAQGDWRWNDQARTYRPASARFDSECQVVVEGFDHTCPWTGTAIGSRNMFWFKIFVCMVPIMLVYTLVVAAFGGILQPFFPRPE